MRSLVRAGKGLPAGRGGGVGFAREAAGDGTRGRGLKKTHNRVGRFAAAFESIQRQLQLEPHPTALNSGAHSPLPPLPPARQSSLISLSLAFSIVRVIVARAEARTRCARTVVPGSPGNLAMTDP